LHSCVVRVTSETRPRQETMRVRRPCASGDHGAGPAEVWGPRDHGLARSKEIGSRQHEPDRREARRSGRRTAAMANWHCNTSTLSVLSPPNPRVPLVPGQVYPAELIARCPDAAADRESSVWSQGEHPREGLCPALAAGCRKLTFDGASSKGADQCYPSCTRI
jgi:hypothetical protein